MKHTMGLNKAPFEMIKSGKKTIELRLYDDKRRLIGVGDEIEFVSKVNTSERLRCTVVKLHVFDSFKELYASLPLLKCGYTESDLATASYTDMNKYYTFEQQNEHSVVGIELELL